MYINENKKIIFHTENRKNIDLTIWGQSVYRLVWSKLVHPSLAKYMRKKSFKFPVSFCNGNASHEKLIRELIDMDNVFNCVWRDLCIVIIPSHHDRVKGFSWIKHFTIVLQTNQGLISLQTFFLP